MAIINNQSHWSVGGEKLASPDTASQSIPPAFEHWQGNHAGFVQAMEQHFARDMAAFHTYMSVLSSPDYRFVLNQSYGLRNYLGIANSTYFSNAHRPPGAMIPPENAPAAWARAATHLDNKSWTQQALHNLKDIFAARPPVQRDPIYNASWATAIGELGTNRKSIFSSCQEMAQQIIHSYKSLLGGNGYTAPAPAPSPAVPKTDFMVAQKGAIGEGPQPFRGNRLRQYVLGTRGGQKPPASVRPPTAEVDIPPPYEVAKKDIPPPYKEAEPERRSHPTDNRSAEKGATSQPLTPRRQMAAKDMDDAPLYRKPPTTEAAMAASSHAAIASTSTHHSRPRTTAEDWNKAPVHHVTTEDATTAASHAAIASTPTHNQHDLPPWLNGSPVTEKQKSDAKSWHAGNMNYKYPIPGSTKEIHFDFDKDHLDKMVNVLNKSKVDVEFVDAELFFLHCDPKHFATIEQNGMKSEEWDPLLTHDLFDAARKKTPLFHEITNRLREALKLLPPNSIVSSPIQDQHDLPPWLNGSPVTEEQKADAERWHAGKMDYKYSIPGSNKEIHFDFDADLLDEMVKFLNDSKVDVEFVDAEHFFLHRSPKLFATIEQNGKKIEKWDDPLLTHDLFDADGKETPLFHEITNRLREALKLKISVN